MKNMFTKTRFAILTGLAVTVLMLSSCGSQDINDQNNLDVNSPSVSIQGLALGLEAGVRDNINTYYRVTGSIGREIYYFQGADPRFTGELLEGPIDNGGFLLLRPWESAYRVIRNGNDILARMSALGLSGEQANGASGFAKTYMAYAHLRNLTYTWDNGIRFDVAGELPGPFIDRAAALDAIAALLDQAYNELTSAGSSFAWNTTSGLAAFDTPATFAQLNRGFKARVDAYRENWQGVLDALSNSFVDANASMDLGAYMLFSLAAGDTVNPVYEDQNGSLLILHGHPSMVTDAEAGDDRLARKINVRSSTTVFDALSSNLGVTTAARADAPYPIMRNEELLLLRAEANIHLGNLDVAATDINNVRAVSGNLGPVNLTDMSSAIDQLLHERRYSLFHEGHRWVDMRRYGKLNELPLDRAAGDAGSSRGPDIVIENMPRPNNET